MEQLSVSQEASEANRADGGSLLRRVRKYKLHYIIVLPGILLIFLFKIVPFVGALYLPFVEFRPFRRVFDNKWIGMSNFTELFRDPAFWNALSYTIAIKFAYIAGCGAAALVLALALSSLKSGKLRNAFTTLMLIPYFIPSLVIAYIAMILLVPGDSPPFHIGTNVLKERGSFGLALVATEVVKTCGIPVLMGLAAIAAKHASSAQSNEAMPSDNPFLRGKVVPALKAVAAFTLLQSTAMLSTDFELVKYFTGPAGYRAGETLDTYLFNLVVGGSNIGVAAASWLLQFIVQLLFALLAYFAVRRWFASDLFGKLEAAAPLRTESRGRRFAGAGLSVAYSLAVLLLLYMLFVYPFVAPSESGRSLTAMFSAGNYLFYLLLYFAATVISLLITLTLAYPLTVKDLPGRGVYKLFLLVIVVMGAGLVHEYLFFHETGMLNTVFPLLFAGFFSVINVFVLKSIFNSKYAGLKEQAAAEGRGELHAFFHVFIPNIWKPLVALGILQFVSLWNSYTLPLLYMFEEKRYSPVAQVVALPLFGAKGVPLGDPVVLQYCALICLPPLILLLVFRKWLTSEVLIGQIRKL